ncbi:phosphoribosylformylglycinamidine synthase II [Candidatus Giovannonibacteria bacterium RIFCSPHIGHO2_02_FULL_44_31]|uniref:Phosphoribosylformylglycinamidine synthase subunit PurL n=1 Tax=Candidatus Giovannonibacteria bacterium RIFCSPLOWO2_12_FULL_44_15 TaxID=1798364 RepID=A0A1F5Y148_9BACT|nr:MAG: phosphoribosylformylglycinamidine synthase II [Candidatus Giovannonibacteria bacterium RIFCSPHIGHO2_02_FULL_44_31]OGF77027.1 MAG: phosphoribosylformylglycinamidine synthase II [Candidatus Giovannonibacteria bacterium RIFCSPHIGHO2_12_FULL_44_29]OGF93860.1 MAG: phosphoribosylformylglycinamidine synthase II [Candidatus Giovannonibacteria bacterium RIFCSPLOWO2_12_FULL_44_15]
MIQVVRVGTKIGTDVRGQSCFTEIRNLGIRSIVGVKTARVYRLEGIEPEDASYLAEKLFTDQLTQVFTLNSPLIQFAARLIEVAYKPGVMNPEAASIMKAVGDLGINLVAADSSTEYGFFGTPSDEDVQFICDRLLVNKTVERVVIEPPITLIISGERGAITIIPICRMSGEELVELSKNHEWHLDLEEMRVLQAHACEIGRDLTDGECETYAQTWSEHCSHKTFRARLIVNGVGKKPLIARIKGTAEKFADGLLSVFDDNAGVIDFFGGQGLCGKVETHNSPCALEPYGGAMTGTGGVLRDIFGDGEGAKPIASTDIFCFAPPDFDPEKLPAGCLSPRYLLRRVVDGVRDYGNRMGVPTNNGSIHFHEDFRAKPTVIVGAYGIIPVGKCLKGKPQPGDRIIVIGGRTGRDGIHGATFSSGEMTDQTVQVNASAVQIGNAIEEKKVGDAVLRCRDEGLIRAITDCGAGGFSSAIGEMGSETGIHVALERAPTKYPGMSPWEIWISESQERMVVAIAPENIVRFFEICEALNVEATWLGVFANTGRLVVMYENETLCDLSMDFLHHGLPQRVLNANWVRPEFEEPEIPVPSDWRETCRRILSHPNVCSKESIVRMYDHSVQGMNALAPFSGVNHDGPNDAVVLTPILGERYGVIISHGLNPILNRIDPYWGSVWAATEALANFVAVGGDPREARLIDNFIWPYPDEQELGALDRSVDACVDIAEAFGIPYISGKDSLSSTYRGKDGTVIKIPPVLCISVFGKIRDVRKTISADFKEEGSAIMQVGLRKLEMAGSVYYDLHGIVGNNLPRVNLKEAVRTFQKLHRLIARGIILSCHDISDGGLFTTLAEMCFGGGMGASLELGYAREEKERIDFRLFNETAGCFLIEVRDMDVYEVQSLGMHAEEIGRTIASEVISVHNRGHVFRADLDELKEFWQKPMKEVFH